MKKITTLLVCLLAIFSFCKAQSCQPFTIQIDSQLVSHPIFDLNDFKICEGDTLTLGAIADFPNNNVYYVQTQFNTRFIWQFDAMTPDTSIVVNKLFNQPIIKSFSLRAVDVNGCNSTNQIQGTIVISSNPIIAVDSNINATTNTTIILNASQDINATLLFQPIEIPQPPLPLSFINYDTVFLPDGNNVCYNNDLIISNFDTNQVLDSIQQIKSIVLNIEHSFMGDLSIRITCPSGQVVILKEQFTNIPPMGPGGVVATACSSKGSSITLGSVSDPISSSPCYLTPGVGWDYHFKPGATGCFGTGGTTVGYVYTDQCGDTWTGPSLNPSVPNIYTTTSTIPVYYGSFQSLSAFIGCPLNGNWRLTICDHWSVDNGFIFNWGINFDESMIGDSIPYVIGVDSVTWNGPNVTTIDPFSASVFHNSAGLYNYTATVHDQFGCQYNAPFTINTTVSVENLSEEPSTIKVFPNPTNGIVSITNEAELIKLIQVYSINGVLLFEQFPNDYNHKLDLSLYQSGVYICKVTESNGCFKQVKIIKK